MTKQIFSAIKVSALALALSFGLSFVYAWTAPTQNPPAGNVSAPINTSATAQTKAGGLTVGGLTLPAGSTITGGGANSTYGSLTVNGSKNGWYGLNFPGAGTLMMHPSYSGFYNSSDNSWRWYVDNAGNSYSNADVCGFIRGAWTCLSQMSQGGVVKYGGGYLMNSKNGTCQWSSNIATGACTCPVGYTARLSSYSVETSGAWYASGYTCESL